LILLVGVYLVLFVWLPGLLPWWVQVTPLGQFIMWGIDRGVGFLVIGLLSCFFVVLGLIVTILGFVVKREKQ